MVRISSLRILRVGLTVSLLTVLMVYRRYQETESVHKLASDNKENSQTKVNSFAGTVPSCSIQQRLNIVRDYCEKNQVTSKYRNHSVDLKLSNFELLDLIEDDELLKISHELWMDPVNKVIVCMHAKAGCSTWKTILANNTSEKPLDQVSAIHRTIHESGMKCADQGQNADEIRHRLKTWFKFAIVRHPFDRLVSSYDEKLVKDSSKSLTSWGTQILSKYRPNIPENVKRQGKGVLFQEFIQYILDGAKDDHFNGPYDSKCHACLLKYDYIVKLETNDHDAEYIVNTKLQGRLSKRSRQNSRRSSADELLTLEGRDLAQYYRNLSAEQYKHLLAKHQSDFDMFGYSMSDAPSYQAKCDGAASGYHCC